MPIMKVEVAYASAVQQKIITLEVPAGCTIQEAIDLSGMLQLFPEIDLNKQAVGVFSRKQTLTTVLNNGDRVEIYRPLTIDPKEARRAKAKMNAKR
jgi:uncharacterized protein